MLKCPQCKKEMDYIYIEAYVSAELREDGKLEWDYTDWLTFTCPWCDTEIIADNPHDAVLICTERGDEIDDRS